MPTTNIFYQPSVPPEKSGGIIFNQKRSVANPSDAVSHFVYETAALMLIVTYIYDHTTAE